MEVNYDLVCKDFPEYRKKLDKLYSALRSSSGIKQYLLEITESCDQKKIDAKAAIGRIEEEGLVSEVCSSVPGTGLEQVLQSLVLRREIKFFTGYLISMEYRIFSRQKARKKKFLGRVRNKLLAGWDNLASSLAHDPYWTVIGLEVDTPEDPASDHEPEEDDGKIIQVDFKRKRRIN